MSSIKSLIPNLLTAGNLVGGILAIIFSLTGRLEWAPYCIFISAFLDFFDGFAARLLNVQSELGKQLDSLADMVTFGVAPGIMVFVMIKIAVLNSLTASAMSDDFMLLRMSFSDAQYLAIYFKENMMSAPHLNNLSMTQFQIGYFPFIAFLIPVMSMFRLAKFNLDTRQSNSFIGLPTPANTIFFAAIPILLSNWVDQHSYDQIPFFIDLILNPWFYIISVPIMSYLLIAEIPLFALKFKTFGWKGNEIRYIFLTLAVALLATLYWIAIPLIIILYVLLSIIQNLRLLRQPTDSVDNNN